MYGDQLKDIVNKVPVGFLFVAWLGYLGFDYYAFTTDASSPLLLKQQEIEASKGENEKLQGKVKEGLEFLKGLEAKRAELRKLASDLESMKGTVTENLDVGDFMKTVVTEAKRVGLTVVAMKPLEPSSEEYYAEQPFELAFKGVYVQLMVFLDRMANMQKIVRVDNFDIRPVAGSRSRYVELEGKVQLKAYRYLASKADDLGKDKAKAPPAAPADAAAKGGST